MNRSVALSIFGDEVDLTNKSVMTRFVRVPGLYDELSPFLEKSGPLLDLCRPSIDQRERIFGPELYVRHSGCLPWCCEYAMGDGGSVQTRHVSVNLDDGSIKRSDGEPSLLSESYSLWVVRSHGDGYVEFIIDRIPDDKFVVAHIDEYPGLTVTWHHGKKDWISIMCSPDQLVIIAGPSGGKFLRAPTSMTGGTPDRALPPVEVLEAAHLLVQVATLPVKRKAEPSNTLRVKVAGKIVIPETLNARTIKNFFHHPISFNQVNPKKVDSKSFVRYDKYKVAATIEEAVELGASFADIVHDFGEFSESSGRYIHRHFEFN